MADASPSSLLSDVFLSLPSFPVAVQMRRASFYREVLINIFYSYSHVDEPLRKKLDKHLALLQHEGLILPWHDREISAGTEWANEINVHLETAQIILLLISSSFLASEYCYSSEMERALERHKAGTARVIPIILRYVDWKNAPFGKLQALPTDGRPIIGGWRNSDEAFTNVASGIRKAVDELRAQNNNTAQNPQQSLKEIKDLQHLKQFKEALIACEQAILLYPNDAKLYQKKGDVLLDIYQYEEALVTLEQAIHLDPTDAVAYRLKGYALTNLGVTHTDRTRFEEALVAIDQAIRLDPTDAVAYRWKCWALINLGEINIKANRTWYEKALKATNPTDSNRRWYEKALVTVEQAIRLDPTDAVAYSLKNQALIQLQRYEEALITIEQAIRLDPSSRNFACKAAALLGLNQFEKALAACEQAIHLDPSNSDAYLVKDLVLKRRKPVRRFIDWYFKVK